MHVTAALQRNNVHLRGAPTGRPLFFAHGYGCDQQMWRHVAPAFERDHRIVLFDHVGAGGSDLEQWSPARYATLHGYANDIVELAEALDVTDAVLIGHSVAAMIAVLAHRLAPHRFTDLVLVAPSPRYIDDTDYIGGFSERDILDLLDTLASNHLGWSRQMAPVIMGHKDRPELSEELTESFCRTDPRIAEHFARVTFLSDHRGDLAHITARCLVLQVADDPLAPASVGDFVHRALPTSELVVVPTHGHCPHISDPEPVTRAIRSFLS